jgi:magnesium transporter
MIKKFRRKIFNKIGQAPGNMEYIGDADFKTSQVILRTYNEADFREDVISDLPLISNNIRRDSVNWIEVTGLNNLEKIQEIGSAFNIHPMLLEDIVNTQHLPKFEDTENYSALILKGFNRVNNSDFSQNHVCIILQDNIIIHFQDFESDILKNKIERIKQSKGRARKLKSDYLFFVLLDAFVDTYYLVFSNINEKISDLEERLLSGANENLMEEIHSLKLELNNLRKHLYPLRDVMNDIIKNETDFISEDNLVFFSDVKDHVSQLIEYYILYNENLKGLVDLNNANQSNNINSVMKTLTIIATLFIPLTFIAGLYGMNFKYMPELELQHGYFIALGVMILVGIVMVIYMKRKRWF